jgi:hypothetical protein
VSDKSATNNCSRILCAVAAKSDFCADMKTPRLLVHSLYYEGCVSRGNRR